MRLRCALMMLICLGGVAAQASDHASAPKSPAVTKKRPKIHPNKPPKKMSHKSDDKPHSKKGLKGEHEKNHSKGHASEESAKTEKGWAHSAKEITDGVSVSVGHHFEAAKEHGFKFWNTKLGVWFADVKAKVEALRHLDEHNLDLIKRVAILESENAKLQYLRAQCEEKERVSQLREQAIEEGGHEGARTLASIQTEDPQLLSKPPKVIFETALRSFEEGDYEGSAKSFVALADNEDNDLYETAQVLFLAGVSLYKIQNYKLALKYLDRAERKAKEKAAGANNVSYAPRALAWKALCAKGLGDHRSRQKFIYELIQKYPKSIEARRLNRHA